MKATPSRPTIIVILGLLMTISPFAIDMYLPSFKLIASDMGSTTERISLSVASYFVGLAIGQLMYGPLLDRFGRKRPLYAGLCLFILTSLGCSLANSVEMLVILRFFQALGGCVAWVGAMAMVRDFFPVKEGAKVFSLLILVLGLSPLLAPTVGGFITDAMGWRVIFYTLAAIVLVILALVYFVLPEGHKPDESVHLRLGPMFRTFGEILRNPQFLAYNLSGSFGFAGLFVYVSGSPVMFMEIFGIDPKTFGLIFAGISIGFVGASQLNIWLLRYYTSELIFFTACVVLSITSVSFLIMTMIGIGVALTIAFIFVMMACIGLMNPNGSTLALAPFDRNLGSASAVIGCTQISIASFVSSLVGVIHSDVMTPYVAIMAATSLISLMVILRGRRVLAPKAS